MSRRTKEGDVLQLMTATLNAITSNQSDPVRFGDVVCSAGFMSEKAARGIMSIGGITNYDKVSRIMSAVVNHVTSQSSPAVVTRKFNQFVLLLYNELSLDGLALQLVEKLSKLNLIKEHLTQNHLK